jgi:hypothetical protein
MTQEIKSQEIIKNKIKDFESEINNMFKLIDIFYIKFKVYRPLEDVITETKDEFIRVNKEHLTEEQINYIIMI